MAVVLGVTATCLRRLACGGSHDRGDDDDRGGRRPPSPTIPPAPTTTTTVPVPTTAVPVIPPAPQPSPEAAANALVGYWASGNRTTALRVATPQAVATLFAVPYPSGLAINRGCTSAFPPIICTFGAPGGGPTNAPIYQLFESQAPGGWYVSSVQIQS